MSYQWAEFEAKFPVTEEIYRWRSRNRMMTEPTLDKGEQAMNDQDNETAENTDRELWRESDSCYADSIHVTKAGAIGINCGGEVIVANVRVWFNMLKNGMALADTVRLISERNKDGGLKPRGQTMTNQDKILK